MAKFADIVIRHEVYLLRDIASLLAMSSFTAAALKLLRGLNYKIRCEICKKLRMVRLISDSLSSYYYLQVYTCIHHL